MDSVLKSWGFRTCRDPFQENSSQGLEANKGQKSTPLREVVCPGTSLEKESPRVCPLERDDTSGQMTGWSQLQLAHALERDEPRANRLLCPLGADCARYGIRSYHLGLAGPPLLHCNCSAFHTSLDQGVETDVERRRGQSRNMVRQHCRSHRIPNVTHSLVGFRRLDLRGRPKVDRGAIATRFFDVLTAPVFQEKKS